MSGDLADARRRAEEALRRVLANAAAIVRLSWSDGATAADCANMERIRSAAADIAQDHKVLRALLAASTPAAGEREEKALQISGMHDSCDWCQREIPDGCYGVLCSECDTKAHDALDTAPPPRPAQDALCPGCGGAGWIPAGDEQLGCIDCNGTGKRPAQDKEKELESARVEAHALLRSLSPSLAPHRDLGVVITQISNAVAGQRRPAQDAVREAAERHRATLDRTCGKYLGGPRLPLVNDLEEHAARLLAALDAAKGGE